jgi:hypothetical protein
LMSCWEKESGCWMSIKAAYRHIAVEGIGRVRRNATAQIFGDDLHAMGRVSDLRKPTV